jgi:predicted dehydrogenase
VLRLGLLSTARINLEILAGAAGSDRVEVVAVASRDGSRAGEYARAHGIPKAHGSYDDLLRDDSVDAVYVSLPNALHHEWTMRALRAGKHVLCEKPYSRSPAEVAQAYGAAERAGLVLTEAFMWRHHPQAGLARSLVSSGRIGRLQVVRSTFSFRLGDPADIRLRPELAGGALMDVGCYCVSGSRLLAGEPTRVSGEGILGASGVDLAFVGVLHFPGEVVAYFDAAFVLPRRQELIAVGEDATLVVSAPWRVDWGGVVEVHENGAVERVPVPAGDSYRLELENLADAVAGVAPPLLGRADAMGQARTIDALYRASREGRSIEL